VSGDITDSSLFAPIASAVISAAITVFISLRTSKTAQERLAERLVSERVAEKMTQETHQVTEQTITLAVGRVENELDRVRADLVEARKNLERSLRESHRYRYSAIEKDNLIERQSGIISQQNYREKFLEERVDQLERWIFDNLKSFRQLDTLSINSAPEETDDGSRDPVNDSTSDPND